MHNSFIPRVRNRRYSNLPNILLDQDLLDGNKYFYPAQWRRKVFLLFLAPKTSPFLFSRSCYNFYLLNIFFFATEDASGSL